jgi:hypothetical protein
VCALYGEGVKVSVKERKKDKDGKRERERERERMCVRDRKREREREDFDFRFRYCRERVCWDKTSICAETQREWKVFKFFSKETKKYFFSFAIRD